MVRRAIHFARSGWARPTLWACCVLLVLLALAHIGITHVSGQLDHAAAERSGQLANIAQLRWRISRAQAALQFYAVSGDVVSLAELRREAQWLAEASRMVEPWLLPGTSTDTSNSMLLQLNHHAEILWEFTEAGRAATRLRAVGQALAEAEASATELTAFLERQTQLLQQSRGAAASRAQLAQQYEDWTDGGLFAVSALLAWTLYRRQRNLSAEEQRQSQRLVWSNALNLQLNARNERLLHASRTAVGVLGVDQVFIAGNDAFGELFGLDMVSATGRPLPLPADTPAAMQQLLGMAPTDFAGERVIEWRRTAQRGEPQWLECVLSRGANAAEQVLTIYDVTRLKRAEERLQLLLRTQQAIIADMPMAVLSGSALGDLDFGNRAAESMFKVLPPGGEAEERAPFLADRHWPAQTEQRLRSASERARHGQVVAEHGLVMQRADGASFVVDAIIVGQHTTTGSALKLTFFLDDVTARHQAEATRVQRLMKQRTALLSQVHHRVKNSLQGIAGLLHRAGMSGTGLTAAATESLSAQVMSLASLHGVRQLRPNADVPLMPLLRSVLVEVTGMLDAEVQFGTAGLDAESARIATAEADSIALILGELLINAVKHGHWRDAVPCPRCTLTAAAEWVEITFANPVGESSRSRAAASSTSSGLELVRSLMPPDGAVLNIEPGVSEYAARLRLSRPVLGSELIHTATFIRESLP